MKVWHISDIAIYMMSGDGIEFSEFWLGDFQTNTYIGYYSFCDMLIKKTALKTPKLYCTFIM